MHTEMSTQCFTVQISWCQMGTVESKGHCLTVSAVHADLNACIWILHIPDNTAFYSKNVIVSKRIFLFFFFFLGGIKLTICGPYIPKCLHWDSTHT